ncbi:MAG: carboxymuconolactone decarboxylase family protein [Acidovorax sp.]|jgi:AhpD family alkylhydroperoxidase|nr:carboxymuconolactone decarboxylase family protein [Acidovorax sp.]
MSTFAHQALIRDINTSLKPFRSSQSEAMKGFAQLAQAAMAEGAISAKHKELIALAIGVTQKCSGCIGFHVKALIKLGTSRQELDEMLAIAVYMGGGPALMYAAEAVHAWEEMSAAAPAAA